MRMFSGTGLPEQEVCGAAAVQHFDRRLPGRRRPRSVRLERAGSAIGHNYVGHNYTGP